MRNTRLLGSIIAGIGAVAVIIGVVGWVSSGGESEDTAAMASTTSTTVALPASTTTRAPTSTTLAPSTTAAETTTTVAATTTTTTIPLGRDDIVAFVDEFSAALEAGDESFVTSRLHPEVVDGFGADLCATWIANEIMTLSNYRLIDEPSGPTDQVFATPNGQRSIADSWSGRVAFTFGGQEFESDAGFAVLDGVVYWLGQCR